MTLSLNCICNSKIAKLVFRKCVLGDRGRRLHNIVVGLCCVLQTIGDDVDPESRLMILSLLQSDQASARLDEDGQSKMSSYKADEAMKVTSRRAQWSNEDKALFDTGVVGVTTTLRLRLSGSCQI